jgi:hypothetical protein
LQDWYAQPLVGCGRVRFTFGVHGLMNDQVPRPKSQSKPNDQAQNPKPLSKSRLNWHLLGFGHWELRFDWDLGTLELGIF